MTRVGQFLGSTTVESRTSTPSTLAGRWRTWVKRTFSTDESGLVLGMFAGDKKSVSPEVQLALRQLGLSHLLAVSGYHVSLVSLVFFLLMQRQQRLLRWGSVLGVPVVWAFVAATGWSLSAIRAATMATLGWWFLVRGKS
ncbi:MAG: ComEC/Rec2 family competence protein, partial [Flavobacteriales bacterium]